MTVCVTINRANKYTFKYICTGNVFKVIVKNNFAKIRNFDQSFIFKTVQKLLKTKKVLKYKRINI